jgi:protocatechuate 3,4-dioxygenase beta subunit
MSEKAKAEKPDVTRQLTTTFAQLFENQGAGLADLRDMESAGQLLLQHEEKRLARKLGQDHPRVRRLRRRRLERLKMIRNLAAAGETANIRVPEVSETEVLVHGRALDEWRRGISGVNVYVTDEKGQIVESAGQATTDAYGYYALKVDPTTLPPDVGDKLMLVVGPSPDRIVYRQTRPLKMAPGAKNLAEVHLERAQLAGKPTRPGPSVKKEVPKEKGGARSKKKRPSDKPWVVSGVVTDADGQPVAGVMVRLFDRDRKYDDKLGAALTNEKGEYKVTYVMQDFSEGPEPGADLYLVVTDEAGKELYTSEENIRYDAGPEEKFDIQIKARKSD